MVFKKMLGAFGVGGPSVDTVLSNNNTRPGLSLTGQVNVMGGTHDVEVEHISLGLVTRMEVEHGDSDYSQVAEFHRIQVAGGLKLAAQQPLSIPFQLEMPWETPVTDVYGQRLHGMTMGLRTEVAIARSVDKGDLDPVSVHPLPVQERILEAFGRLGFRFKSADLEYGRIHGVPQTLPFFQEIEFFPPPRYGGINEVELTFVANPHAVAVVLEFDKRGGMFSRGHDSYGHYSVAHTEADTVDWAQRVDGWIREAVGQRQTLLGGMGHGFGPGGYGPGHGGGYGPGYGPDHGHGHRRGSGMGGVVGGAVAGAALGVAGGMIMGEMLDDAFDGGDDGGDFGDDGGE